MTYRFDPELAAVVPMLPAVDFADPRALRAQIAEFANANQPDLAGVDVLDLRVPGPPGSPKVPVRVYRPAGLTGMTAGLLNIHGGGFMIGSIAVDDAACLDLVRGLGVVIVSVEYRLAPEHPFPAGLEDCYAVLEWIAKAAGDLGIDPTRLAAHGVSAGGGLAAALALLTRDRGGPPLCFQFLGYPEVDDRLETGSTRRFVDTPLWNRPNAVISWNAYLGEGVPGTPDVSPYAAPARGGATQRAGRPAGGGGRTAPAGRAGQPEPGGRSGGRPRPRSSPAVAGFRPGRRSRSWPAGRRHRPARAGSCAARPRARLPGRG
ncbi:alpha/beta hydrolase fold domain-containing protein [Frankia sp. AgB1.8]|uniref:alpha/beta hydrolase fold domain-containing protein n=1 Tax=Frankia sp. AgB1.8 TaxID=2792839 RepID=UPI001933A3EC|nr:alpha/beta hydrolase fold domain-containing protein [Frankia sp. AgB1.8]MBL7625133.1 alpha/beta hydrolase fold domain-containing protein [Frankia sp. AgB1.8]